MTVEEIIEKLQEIKKKHGDALQCYTYEPNDGGTSTVDQVYTCKRTLWDKSQELIVNIIP